jgi:hypothetical protein
MPNSWHQAYKELTDFIAKHSEVGIEASRVSIPANVRPEFYRLFNTVRTSFVEERITDLLNEAKSLSEEYTKVEGEVVKLLELEKISLAASLHRFLHNPIDELVRGLFDPLFDLLKGRLGTEVFEQKVSKRLETSLRNLYFLGYDKWIALSLIKLLEADKLFCVTLRLIKSAEEEMIETEVKEEEAPPPKESKSPSFDRTQERLFMIPDFIVHSTKADKYIALRSEMDEAEAIALASNASETREWYSLYSMPAFEPGLTLIYTADKAEEISLVADAKRICRPDLIIECRGGKDWYKKEGLEKVKLNNNILKPRLGSYIISREPVPKQYLEELEEGINMLTVSFEQSKLEPIISMLMNQEDKEQ